MVGCLESKTRTTKVKREEEGRAGLRREEMVRTGKRRKVSICVLGIYLSRGRLGTAVFVNNYF